MLQANKTGNLFILSQNKDLVIVSLEDGKRATLENIEVYNIARADLASVKITNKRGSTIIKTTERLAFHQRQTRRLTSVVY